MSDSKYLSYYKKLPLFKRYERKTPVSSLLDLTSIPVIGSSALNENCINSKNQLVKLIRDREKKYNFIYEGLIKTYPTDKLISRYVKICHETLDDSLLDLKLSDFPELCEYVDDDVEDMPVAEYHIADSIDIDRIASTIAFLLPQHKGADPAAIVSKIIDDIYVCGYDVIDISKLNIHSTVYDVYCLNFEAKYTHVDFDISEFLFHVAPLSAVSKICRQGLIPRCKSLEFKYPDRIYMFNNCDFKTVEDYGKYKAAVNNGSKFCVFRLNGRKVTDKVRLYADPTFSFESNGKAEAFFTYDSISPDLIDDEVLIIDVNTSQYRTVSKTTLEKGLQYI